MFIPIMPKATAVWLIENTSLTFEQIADFCNMHVLEIKAIADGEVAQSIAGVDPKQHNGLTEQEIGRCESDSDAKLTVSESVSMYEQRKVGKRKGSKYVPVARRSDKPNAILWFLKYHPNVEGKSISRLIGATQAMINSVKERTHWNMANIRPSDPVLLGLCSQIELNKVIEAVKESDAQKNG